MKLGSRYLVVAGICAGLSIASAGYIYAADAPQSARMRSADAPRHAMHDPVAAAQQRLDRLGKKLNLKPSQQDAWKSFSAGMLKLAQEHAQEMGKGPLGDRSKLEELSTPDKMEKMAAAMRKHADSLSKLASDTKPFYDQLSPEQKTIFDLYAKNAWHNRMQQGMQHRMH